MPNYSPYPDYSVMTTTTAGSIEAACELTPLTHPSMLQHPPPPLAAPPPMAAPAAAGYAQVVYNCNVMSPSLTSGFSGSGGDCKSTETSSIMSAASFSSTAMQQTQLHANRLNGKKAKQAVHQTGMHTQKEAGGGGNAPGANVKKGGKKQPAAAAAAATAAGEAGKQEANNGAGSPEVAPSTENEMKSSAIPAVMCDVCQLPFPSMTVLENHLNGNRHARRVKSKEALKQLLDSGVQFHHEEGVSEMRCEICRMSVNSSHQLQAHLQG